MSFLPQAPSLDKMLVPKRVIPRGGKDNRLLTPPPRTHASRVRGRLLERGRFTSGVATYRVNMGGHLSGENAWLPMAKTSGYLTGER